MLIVLCSKAVPKEADREMQVFFCILYFWNTQQKRGEISVRQFSTGINELACEVRSCFGHF